ncbi:MAG: MobF family relaxase [Gaiellaceae bacterium]
MAKLTVGQEAYYEQQVATGVDDYYAGRGESPGIWAGSGAAGLGLEGVVGDGHLGTLLRGVDPGSGRTLRAPVARRTITVRTLDPESGAWREEKKRLAPVAGFDLVFSCPKSVSLLHTLTDDESVRRAVSDAHESAWQASLAYLEREACVVRRGQGGAVREHGAGFVAAAFRHRTSRAQDPHLHTHVIVANMARAPDGEWRALDGEPLLRTYRLADGYLYEAHLRHELTRMLGVRWTEPVKGMGELEGVPTEALRAFSTRRQSLVEHMQARGTKSFAASRVAALATREAKEQVELPRLREQWKARAAELGLGRRELRQVVGQPRAPAQLGRGEVAQRLFARDGLTEKQTTFTMPELVRGVAERFREGASVDEVLEAAAELARFPGVELLEPEHSPGRPARFTTRELLDVEREALELALAGRDAGAPRALTGQRASQADLGLSAEQRRLVREGCLSTDRILCAVGVAGAGKTTALRLLGDIFEEAGVPVLGTAPSGRAADELARATGIHSRTLHRLLLDARERGGLPHRTVLLVDEAGMAETRILAPILRLVDEAGGKAILVGDPAQLPSVAAGGLFAALCERLGPVTLEENRRQLDPAERAALAHLRAGDPEPYLSDAAFSGRLHLADDVDAAKERLLEDWWKAAEQNPRGRVMLAYRRSDVHELNEAARQLLIQAGRLGDETLEAGEREFRVGDRILCRRNDHRLGVRNGLRGTIVDLDHADRTLTLETDAGPHRVLPAAYAAEHLEHGYALTGHAAQGATFEHAFALLRDEGALREWGYVACSRARTETRLYLVGAGHEREAHGRDLEPRDVSDRLADALTTSASERLALEHADPTLDTRERLLEEHRRRVEEARANAEQRLAHAEVRLEELGWRGRRRHGSELQAEIALEQATLRLAEKKLAELDSLPATTPVPTRPRAPAPAPGRSRNRELAHEVHLEPPGVSLEI